LIFLTLTLYQLTIISKKFSGLLAFSGKGVYYLNSSNPPQEWRGFRRLGKGGEAKKGKFRNQLANFFIFFIALLIYRSNAIKYFLDEWREKIISMENLLRKYISIIPNGTLTRSAWFCISNFILSRGAAHVLEMIAALPESMKFSANPNFCEGTWRTIVQQNLHLKLTNIAITNNLNRFFH